MYSFMNRYALNFIKLQIFTIVQLPFFVLIKAYILPFNIIATISQVGFRRGSETNDPLKCHSNGIYSVLL